MPTSRHLHLITENKEDMIDMKKEYVMPEFKFVFMNAKNILTTSKEKDPFVEDPFAPID